MSGSNITIRRFTYINDPKVSAEAIDVHHVIVQQSNLKNLFVCLLGFSFLTNGFCLFLFMDSSPIILLWSLVLSSIFLKLGLGRSVVKESVFIMPGFGVQLETHYRSGRVLRRFVPVSKILKPVLLERVTPVTCYWVLSLILCEEEELSLVFKELHPPLKMLVPIWKALCAAAAVCGEKE